MGIEVSRFGASIGRYAAFWSRDIDKGIHADIREVLGDKTVTSRARVCETTFGGTRACRPGRLPGTGARRGF